MSSPERFALVLEAPAGGHTARSLARLLKRLSRAYGIRCRSVRRVAVRRSGAKRAA